MPKTASRTASARRAAASSPAAPARSPRVLEVDDGATDLGETRTMSTGELRRSLADVLNLAYYAGERTVVERDGKPVAAVVPLGDLAELLDLDAADMAAVEEAFAEDGEPVALEDL